MNELQLKLQRRLVLNGEKHSSPNSAEKGPTTSSHTDPVGTRKEPVEGKYEIEQKSKINPVRVLPDKELQAKLNRRRALNGENEMSHKPEEKSISNHVGSVTLPAPPVGKFLVAPNNEVPRELNRRVALNAENEISQNLKEQINNNPIGPIVARQQKPPPPPPHVKKLVTCVHADPSAPANENHAATVENENTQKVEVNAVKTAHSHVAPPVMKIREQEQERAQGLTRVEEDTNIDHVQEVGLHCKGERADVPRNEVPVRIPDETGMVKRQIVEKNLKTHFNIIGNEGRPIKERVKSFENCCHDHSFWASLDNHKLFYDLFERIIKVPIKDSVSLISSFILQKKDCVLVFPEVHHVLEWFIEISIEGFADIALETFLALFGNERFFTDFLFLSKQSADGIHVHTNLRSHLAIFGEFLSFFEMEMIQEMILTILLDSNKNHWKLFLKTFLECFRYEKRKETLFINLKWIISQSVLPVEFRNLLLALLVDIMTEAEKTKSPLSNKNEGAGDDDNDELDDEYISYSCRIRAKQTFVNYFQRNILEFQELSMVLKKTNDLPSEKVNEFLNSLQFTLFEFPLMKIQGNGNKDFEKLFKPAVTYLTDFSILDVPASSAMTYLTDFSILDVPASSASNDNDLREGRNEYANHLAQQLIHVCYENKATEHVVNQETILSTTCFVVENGFVDNCEDSSKPKDLVNPTIFQKAFEILMNPAAILTQKNQLETNIELQDQIENGVKRILETNPKLHSDYITDLVHQLPTFNPLIQQNLKETIEEYHQDYFSKTEFKSLEEFLESLIEEAKNHLDFQFRPPENAAIHKKETIEKKIQGILTKSLESFPLTELPVMRLEILKKLVYFLNQSKHFSWISLGNTIESEKIEEFGELILFLRNFYHRNLSELYEIIKSEDCSLQTMKEIEIKIVPILLKLDPNFRYEYHEEITSTLQEIFRNHYPFNRIVEKLYHSTKLYHLKTSNAHHLQSIDFKEIEDKIKKYDFNFQFEIYQVLIDILTKTQLFAFSFPHHGSYHPIDHSLREIPLTSMQSFIFSNKQKIQKSILACLAMFQENDFHFNPVSFASKIHYCIEEWYFTEKYASFLKIHESKNKDDWIVLGFLFLFFELNYSKEQILALCAMDSQQESDGNSRSMSDEEMEVFRREITENDMLQAFSFYLKNSFPEVQRQFFSKTSLLCDESIQEEQQPEEDGEETPEGERGEENELNTKRKVFHRNLMKSFQKSFKSWPKRFSPHPSGKETTRNLSYSLSSETSSIISRESFVSRGTPSTTPLNSWSLSLFPANTNQQSPYHHNQRELEEIFDTNHEAVDLQNQYQIHCISGLYEKLLIFVDLLKRKQFATLFPEKYQQSIHNTENQHANNRKSSQAPVKNPQDLLKSEEKQLLESFLSLMRSDLELISRYSQIKKHAMMFKKEKYLLDSAQYQKLIVKPHYFFLKLIKEYEHAQKRAKEYPENVNFQRNFHQSQQLLLHSIEQHFSILVSLSTFSDSNHNRNHSHEIHLFYQKNFHNLSPKENKHHLTTKETTKPAGKSLLFKPRLSSSNLSSKNAFDLFYDFQIEIIDQVKDLCNFNELNINQQNYRITFELYLFTEIAIAKNILVGQVSEVRQSPGFQFMQNILKASSFINPFANVVENMLNTAKSYQDKENAKKFLDFLQTGYKHYLDAIHRQQLQQSKDGDKNHHEDGDQPHYLSFDDWMRNFVRELINHLLELYAYMIDRLQYKESFIQENLAEKWLDVTLAHFQFDYQETTDGSLTVEQLAKKHVNYLKLQMIKNVNKEFCNQSNAIGFILGKEKQHKFDLLQAKKQTIAKTTNKTATNNHS